MAEEKKILFKYQSLNIDSVYVFDDGDFFIFGNGESVECFKNKIYSTLFDGKNFKSKLTLDVSSDSCFFDLKNDDEFGMCINYKFTLNKFNPGRTSFKEIQPINLNEFETGRKLMRLLNGDILFFKFYMGSQSISVFKKSYEDSYLNQSDYMYINDNKFNIDDLEEIIELDKNQILGYKRAITTPESLILKIYDDNYQIKRKNKIIAEIKDEIYSYKKKLYFTTNMQKIKNKLICGGCHNIYIIDINSLELETTIKLEKTIKKILIRPKGNIFVLTYIQEKFKPDLVRETNSNYVEFYLNNIKIDLKTNEMISNNEKNITDQAGIYNSFFDFYNYSKNGLIANIDKSKVIIYKNYDD